ncbi:MAG: L-threonylcarbamoyladenylate synthase, partial [Bacteroidota bacterium]
MKQNIQQIADCLLKDGVVLIPTDTVYGLAVAPYATAAVERLYALKERPRERKLPIMVADIQQLLEVGILVNEKAQKVFHSSFSPGAVTVVMGVKESKAAWLTGRTEVAVRIPNDECLLAVLRKTGPLFVTSANRHGQATPETIAEIVAQLTDSPDLVIDGWHLPV